MKVFTFFEMVVHFPCFRPIYSISKLVCTLMACIFELTLPKSFASSANSFIHDRTTSGRSFINMKNNIGPNTLPCGIPIVTFADFELLPSITTFCDLPVKNSFIQLCHFPWIPYPQSFLIAFGEAPYQRLYENLNKLAPRVCSYCGSWILMDLDGERGTRFGMLAISWHPPMVWLHVVRICSLVCAWHCN